MVVTAVAGFAAGSIVGVFIAAFSLSSSIGQSRDQAGLVVELERLRQLRGKDRSHVGADTSRGNDAASGNGIATSSPLERLQNDD